MRLWSLHPRLLDRRGLVALWREALLAQAVFAGKTRGYTRHPQLMRFRAAHDPLVAIAVYLRAVHGEAVRRGYAFDARRIGPAAGRQRRLTVTDGQIAYEWRHLNGKLRARDPAWLSGLKGITLTDPHPLFRVVPGAIEPWELIGSRRLKQST
jgi:hypothetical protein